MCVHILSGFLQVTSNSFSSFTNISAMYTSPDDFFSFSTIYKRAGGEGLYIQE